MRLDQLLGYARSRRDATEDQPFGDNVVAFRINNRIFALVSMSEQIASVNLKCDPERAVELRECYEAVRPGYHMNKKHWNTVLLDGSIKRRDIEEMIDHSYELVSRAGRSKRNI